MSVSFSHNRTQSTATQNSDGFSFQAGDDGEYIVRVQTADYNIFNNDAGFVRPYAGIGGSFGDALNLANGGGGSDGKGGVAKVTYTFSGAAQSVHEFNFRIENILSGSVLNIVNRPVVRVVAYDNDGNMLGDESIRSTLGENVLRADDGTAYLERFDYQTVDGHDTRDGVSFYSDGTRGNRLDPNGWVDVSITRPSGGSISRIEVFYSQEPPAGYAGSAGQQSVFISNASFVPICFARDTEILTEDGPVAVQDLFVGDLVQTRDHGLQPIRWIGRKLVQNLRELKQFAPIRISAGALGPHIPAADLLVSPQHRILVRSKIAQRMFGTNEVLVAAKQLCGLDGISVEDGADQVEYFHLLFERHEIVMSNGAQTESLLTGPQALQSVGPAARDEIFSLFPELRDRDYQAIPARPMVAGRVARKLADRHARNSKSLIG